MCRPADYPSSCRRTHTAAETRGAEHGFACGRITGIAPASIALADESGAAELVLDRAACPGIGRVAAGDLAEVQFERGRAIAIRLLAKAASPPQSNADYARFNAELKAALRLRAELLAGVRSFFNERGFLEIETPALVPSPGLELHLRAFAADYAEDSPDVGKAGGRRQRVFLPTSPEYHMKRLLASGFERIFQLCRSFRNGESFSLHNPEFAMLEWYRAWADYSAIMADMEQLGARLAAMSGRAAFRGARVDFSPPWSRITVRDAFREFARVELPPETEHDAFRRAARSAGFAGVADSDTWEDVFYKLFLSAIEPKLGFGKPAFLTEYPASMAALAKKKESDPSVAERFEIFIAGVEIGNGFTELNDPAEQRRRFVSELNERRRLNAPEHPIDERLLDALAIGMPPSGGVAVGIDRLIMILAGKENIEDVIAFPFSHDFPAGS